MCNDNRHTTFKTYENYTAITCQTSLAYKMLHSDRCVYSNDGLIYIDGYLAVAMGQRFGKTGDKLRITFDDGHQMNCILADVKAIRHTDESNCHTRSFSVMEILVNPSVFKYAHKFEYGMGNCNTLPGLNGMPIKVEKVGQF